MVVKAGVVSRLQILLWWIRQGGRRGSVTYDQMIKLLLEQIWKSCLLMKRYLVTIKQRNVVKKGKLSQWKLLKTRKPCLYKANRWILYKKMWKRLSVMADIHLEDQRKRKRIYWGGELKLFGGHKGRLHRNLKRTRGEVEFFFNFPAAQPPGINMNRPFIIEFSHENSACGKSVKIITHFTYNVIVREWYPPRCNQVRWGHIFLL